MSGEFEAAGALATAGIVAGAIERRGDGESGSGECLNCGAKLEGAYCSACGQAAHPHRKLTHVFEELLHGVIHFDTKAWRTLPMVIFRPGTLTRNYVYGKRARYISPIALFLFTIFFMFFVFAFWAPKAPDLNMTETATVEEAQEELAEAREEVAQAQRDLAEARANPDPDQPEGLELRMAQLSVDLAEDEVERREQALARVQAALAAAQAQEETPAVASEEPAAPVETAPTETTQNSAAEAPEEAPATVSEDGRVTRDYDGTWQDAAREIAESDNFVIVEGADGFNERIRKKFENPDLAIYKIQQAAYKFSFLLAPLSLPFIALLFFWKRGVTLYDHMAFALYALSFASLLFVAIVLTSQSTWTNWLPGILLCFALPVHTYFHLKGAYALGWFSALWRTFFMLNFAIIIAVIFLILIIVLGLAG